MFRLHLIFIENAINLDIFDFQFYIEKFSLFRIELWTVAVLVVGFGFGFCVQISQMDIGFTHFYRQ